MAIKYKLKECIGCNEEKYIYARKMCRWCYIKFKQKEYANKPKKKKRKRISPISVKQEKLLKEYRVVRDEFMSSHPLCEARLEGCQNKATDCHHLKHKTTREDYLDPNNFLSVCRKCHNRIHDNPKESYAKGLLIKKHL